jgi:hypothetical protein
MRLPFKKKPTQTPCQLDNGVFSTPGTLTLTKKLLSFEPSDKVDVDAGVSAVNIPLKNITGSSLGMHQRKLTIRSGRREVAFSGPGMTLLQRQLKTILPKMRATKVKDKRASFRLDLGGRYEATVGIARLADTSVEAKVLDLSTTGCSILTGANLRVGDYVNVEVLLHDNTKTTVFGRCVRLNRANPTENMVGVKFLSVRRTTTQELSDFIMKRQRERRSTIEAA